MNRIHWDLLFFPFVGVLAVGVCSLTFQATRILSTVLF